MRRDSAVERLKWEFKMEHVRGALEHVCRYKQEKLFTLGGRGEILLSRGQAD